MEFKGEGINEGSHIVRFNVKIPRKITKLTESLIKEFKKEESETINSFDPNALSAKILKQNK